MSWCSLGEDRDVNFSGTALIYNYGESLKVQKLIHVLQNDSAALVQFSRHGAIAAASISRKTSRIGLKKALREAMYCSAMVPSQSSYGVSFSYPRA